MAVAHRTTWTNSTPALALTIATSTTAGDALVAWAVSDSQVTTFTWPLGFVEQARLVTTFDSQVLGVALKTNATGLEGSLIITGSNNIIGGISAFSGCDTATQPDVASTTGNNNTGSGSPWTIDAAAMTPVTNGSGIVAVMGSDANSASADPVHSFSGGALTWAVHGDINSTFFNAGLGFALQTTAAAITVTGTGTHSGQSAGRSIVVVALRPTGGAAARQQTLGLLGVGI